MLPLSLIWFVFGYSIYSMVLVASEELLVDPMSIFVDPNLYQFCWNQFGMEYNKEITGHIKASNQSVKFKAFQDNQYGNKTYCISKRDRQNIYNLKLQMTKSSKSPKYIEFKIKFYLPLGPQLDIIQMSTVPNGVYFEVNPEFAGVSSSLGPRCHVLLISELPREKIFIKFILKQLNMSFQSIARGYSFSVYYSCIMMSFVESSTKFVAKTGFIGYDGRTEELEPILKMPFRRFIMAAWKHSAKLSRRYDVAIYEKTTDMDVCIKLFRIYVNVVPKPVNQQRRKALKCDGNIFIEDLYHSNNEGSNTITVILDMVKPLRMYRNYKFVIYWETPSGKLMNNYLPFNPLPNENIGNINGNLFEYGSVKYEQLINEVSNMYQTILSINTENPYKGTLLSIPGYDKVDIYSSTSTGDRDTITPEKEMDVRYLYKKCISCHRSISPYFYAVYHTSSSSGTVTEIVQLPIPKNINKEVKHVTFEPSEHGTFFTLSWNLSEYSTTPGIYAAEIQFVENETCHTVYILRCKTCNERYMQDTQSAYKKKKPLWKENCLSIKEFYGHYDAIASNVKMNTEIMTPFVNFHARIVSYISDEVLLSEFSSPNFITETYWQKRGKLIIGSVSGLSIVILIVAILWVYKYRASHQKSMKVHEGKTKKFDEDVYDADICNEEIYDVELSEQEVYDDEV